MKALLALALLSTPALAQEAATGCGPYRLVLGNLAADYHELPIVRALSSNGSMITITVSASGRTYTVLASKPDAEETTCVVGQGHAWQSVMPPLTGDPA